MPTWARQQHMRSIFFAFEGEKAFFFRRVLELSWPTTKETFNFIKFGPNLSKNKDMFRTRRTMLRTRRIVLNSSWADSDCLES